MKRFTDSLKWTDPWFRCLSAPAKLLWVYLLDHCDNIGLVEINLKLTSSDCGVTIKQEHIEELGDRIQQIEGGKLFIRKFISFQYGTLSENCVPHKKVIQGIRNHSLVSTFGGYLYPSPRVGDRVEPTLKDSTRRVQEEEENKNSTRDIQGTREKGTLDEMMAFCRESGLFPRDAESCFHKWEGNGWTNGKQKIKDWKATIRAWKAQGFLPSQKNPSPSDHWPEPQAEAEAEPEIDLMAKLQANIAKRKAAEEEASAPPENLEGEPEWT